ncbi:bifunctional 4-hydroxy-2-oxoglutarate aldolase/2-dehydro-3-deoxy-phosphogluconate aldolase [[Clostridium] symbiosum]|uniref:bifunctional 4-hydroxy-2-oxoglutarate aldolase/2-dehydro-3-deoxy-phosphogluconate aldolase n=1 Tax=Clostridium symbiosum TaxID=1512 RepID=UPI001D0854DD|nr:bifunctional 4-hydroxy-2-oxoglutarate aldolase/2-dehydro-3-deoxy-phosphogluconate aldolase [[Clostridium] symbiosum]MCB6609614.1 bifunctional 4-hydroxy-2-oxoglutarate aldolase/2-dehydro-3-deoxy-phosphogluconate aldolase [[Clostridium] symbiosum]MCB6933144.1 bifunctional 4-hydroxy-2-oxoglutarate aldolase/2-dehydro-3-deoxy-phosphogluconate aldolase [[Clostridium] symbiosum]
MSNVMELIKEKRIVPVVKLDHVEDALPLAKALIDGGLPVAEITFRTDAAEESIRVIRNTYPEMLCGAGTVVNIDQAERAVAAGAAFIVSPGFTKEVVEFAVRKNIPVLPGCCTPTEIIDAMNYGLKVVKFFPAKQYGGLDTIKALAAPFPGIRFMPTGGINTGNLREFLDNDKIYACGGSWMVADSLIKEKRFDEITRLTKEAVELAK